MKASELAADARDELSMNYVSGQYSTQEGNVCSISALERVAVKTMAIQQAGVVQKALEEKCLEVYGFRSIPRTHDAIGKGAMLDLWDKTVIGLLEIGE